MSEADLMRRLQKFATTLGARLFRQNTGMAWVGEIRHGPGLFKLGPHDILIRNARPFHAGVSGMSDLGGWSPQTILPEMVGSTVAIYSQVEVKERGRPTAEQTAWVDAVNAAGGRAGFAYSEADVIRILRR